MAEPKKESPREELGEKRKRVEDAMKKKKLPDLDSALEDFETLLNSDDKKEEKPLLDKAHELQDQLRWEGTLPNNI